MPVCQKDFQTKQEAWDYAVHLQTHRRNLIDSDLFRLMKVVDKRIERQKDPETGAFTRAQGCAQGKSAEITAKIQGVSARKVEQMRTIAKYGDPEIMSALERDEISINQAYKGIQEKKAETSVAAGNDTAKQKKNSRKDQKTSTTQTQGSVSKQNQAPAGKQSEQSRPDTKSVTLSDDHFAALKELGGLIEDHIADAIDCYLEMIAGQKDAMTSNQAEYDDDYFDGGDYDD